ncbi:MAG: protein kinase [Planctomycetes bacterium]|nr:protein kinase [Planctomycetota bacterium]
MTVEEIFSAAIERRTAQERSSYLDGVCGRETSLRRQVDRLLAAHESAGSFLEGGPFGAATSGPSARDARPPLSVGASIGPYLLTSVVGEGGMGTVYEAQQTAPVRRTVAIKVVRSGVGSAAVLRRFETERQAAARMEHPHVARVLDAGATEDGRPYFVMELFRGKPLTDYCDETRRTVRERVELLVSVCRAVQHAHQKGVVHRDLKPGNVLVAERDGRPVPKVIDFGVAKAVGVGVGEETGQTQQGQLLGTVRYMAPEQAELDGSDVDTRTDVHALGVLLYELLTGRSPFDDDEAKERGLLSALARVREAEPVAPSVRIARAADRAAVSLRRGTTPRGLVGQVRGELEWIVARCLEKHRDRRYPTADALARDLERYLSGRAVSVGPPSAWYRARKALRRHRTAAAAAGLSLAFLVAGGVGVGWVMRERATRRAAVEGEVVRALDEADREQASGRWDDALAAARRAEALLAGSDGLGALRERAVRRREDLEFVRDVDRIRHRAAADLDQASLDPAYADAFRTLGVDVEATPRSEAARLLRARSVRPAVVGALIGWSSSRFSVRRIRGTGTPFVELAALVDADSPRARIWGLVLRDDWTELSRAPTRDEIAELPADLAFSLAAMLRSQGCVAQARDVAVEALRRYPGDYFLNFEVGCALAAVGRPEEACRYLTAAIALRPASAPAHDNLASMLDTLGRTVEAEIVFRRAIELQPQRSIQHSNLAILLHKAGRLEEAEVAARDAVSLDARDAEAWAELARIRFNRKRYPQAAEAATESIRLRPNDASMRLVLANSHLLAGRTEDAVAAYRETLRLDPRHPGTKLPFATALWARGDRTEAIVMNREAILADPDSAPARYSLGVYLGATGDDAGAIRSYREAIRLDEGHAEAHCNLGQLLLRHEAYVEAVDRLRRGHELGSKRPDWGYPSDRWVADAELASGAARILPTLGAMRPEEASARVDLLLADPRASRGARTDVLHEAAARALAIAAGSLSPAGPDLRPVWRRLALAWFRRDLDLWPEPSPASDPELAERVHRGLLDWQSERHFGSVRGAAIETIPEDERAPWRAFWAEIGRRVAATAPARAGDSPHATR